MLIVVTFLNSPLLSVSLDVILFGSSTGRPMYRSGL